MKRGHRDDVTVAWSAAPRHRLAVAASGDYAPCVTDGAYRVSKLPTADEQAIRIVED